MNKEFYLLTKKILYQINFSLITNFGIFKSIYVREHHLRLFFYYDPILINFLLNFLHLHLNIQDILFIAKKFNKK